MMEPRWNATLNGNILARAMLVRFIREFIKDSSIPPGYYLEFGVLNGASMIESYGALRGLVTGLYGFDTFTGLPKLSAEDQEAFPLMPMFHEHNFASMGCEAVRNSVLANTRGLTSDQVTLVEGNFEQTLPAFDVSSLADKGPCLLANVDCDLYSSSVTVFAFLDQIVTTGTWLLLDDYWCYRGSPKLGQRRAFDEWMASSARIGTTGYCNYNGFGRAFIAYEK